MFDIFVETSENNVSNMLVHYLKNDVHLIF